MVTLSRRVSSAPRARGDGPEQVLITPAGLLCSPRTRGWSLGDGLGGDGDALLPAHAGMVPETTMTEAERIACSPRTRGWSLRRVDEVRRDRLLPAHAGMVPPTSPSSKPPPTAPRARGDGPRPSGSPPCGRSCSPRTRGWSPLTTCGNVVGVLLPAHAGMVPGAEAGAARQGPAPRARGDGPWPPRRCCPAAACSPRTRGWSRTCRFAPLPTILLPAHAGMVPRATATGARPAAAPRARGDGPRSTRLPFQASACSPRTRGWSRVLRARNWGW